MRTTFLISLLFAASPVFADISDIIAEFQQADVIILGEIHDNPHHHIIQSEITKAIQPSAIVFEMFTQEQAETINTLRWADAGLRSLADEFEWHKTGWPAFGNYARILEADPEGVVFGGTAPRDDVNDAMFEGAAVVFGIGAEIYNLYQPLSDVEYKYREAAQVIGNCGTLPENASGLIEAQRLRDALFADTIIRALDEVGGPVIVITGNAAAHNTWGLPAVLTAAFPEILVVSLGQFEVIPDDVTSYTRTLLSNAVYRKDPCLEVKG